MQVLWNAFEILDRATIVTLTKTDEMLSRAPFRERIEKAVAHVRPAQKAIAFEK
jgi:hypothetical protein